MNTKKLLLAWLATFVVTFVLAGLWHVVLLGDFYRTNDVALARAEQNMLFVALGQLILAFLMAFAYPIGYKGGSPVKEGFRFGALIGIIWMLPWSVQMHGLWNYPLAGIIVDSPWHVIQEGIGGIVIGLIYGTGKQ